MKLSEINDQYIGSIINYCDSQKHCGYCVFKTVEDEIADMCPFHIQPEMYYDFKSSIISNNHNCYTCGHAESKPGSFHCMVDDVEIMPCEAGEQCACWSGDDSTFSKKETVAKNATVQKRIELIEE